MLNKEQNRHVWYQAKLSLVWLLLLAMVFYRQTVFYLTSVWNQLATGEYGHGYLVLMISAYLIFQQRHRLSQLTPSPDYRALLAILLSSLLWMVAVLVNVEIVQAVALLLLLLSVVWLVSGSRVTLKLLFPLLFISFAIPIWFPLSPFLRDLTANVVFDMVRLLKIPAFQYNDMIVLPSGTLSIENACNGMRYLLAALTLGALYGYLNYRNYYARLVVVIIVAIAAVLANILRVFIVVYLGYMTEMQSPVVRNHMMLGWYLFGGLVMVLLFIDIKLSRWWRTRHAAGVIASDVSENKEKTGNVDNIIVEKSQLQKMLLLIAAVVMLLTGPMAVYFVRHQIVVNPATIELILPAGSDGWTGPVEKKDTWIPVYHGAVATKQAYIKNDKTVFLYTGYYPVQKQGQELITYFNRISHEDNWHPVYIRAVKRNIGNKQVLEQLLRNRQGKQRLVWYWYNVDNRDTTNEYEAKVLQVIGMLSGTTGSYVIAVAMNTDDSLTETRNQMKNFIHSMKTLLPRVVNAAKVPAER